ncbi:MAG: UDP-N-acetylmuramoyl-L-alanyl-D-glutamate--2,6-diaminopimelate ligase [Clostridia bacterium]
MLKKNIKEYVIQLEKFNLLQKKVKIEENLDKKIEKVSYSSNDVEKGTLFVCKGNNFKEEYLVSSIEKGAEIYISEREYNVDIPGIIVTNVQDALSIVSQVYYNSPADKLTLIATSGTKGKSTTAYYIKYILDEYAAANSLKDTAIISSIDTYDGVTSEESHITTPESLDLQGHLNNAVNAGLKNVVMEVSSQALKYGRVYNLLLDYGIFLNISEDHISAIEHADFADYFASKLKIFKQVKTVAVNLDADHIEEILDASKAADKVISFSVKNKEADVYAYNIRKQGLDTVFSVKSSTLDMDFVLTMPGLFNVENALAAICITEDMQIPAKYIYEGLKKARSSGRMEIYSSEDKKVVAIVDYAHNKLSFQKLFESTRAEYPGRKISIIFGCPGGKAFLRRKDLGIEAGKYADTIYLVAEDPGYEAPSSISKEISEYVKEFTDNFKIIDDRGEAIHEAILSVKGDEVILITGKGNETRQKFGSTYVPCKSDVEYVTEYIKEYNEVKAMKIK